MTRRNASHSRSGAPPFGCIQKQMQAVPDHRPYHTAAHRNRAAVWSGYSNVRKLKYVS